MQTQTKCKNANENFKNQTSKNNAHRFKKHYITETKTNQSAKTQKKTQKAMEKYSKKAHKRRKAKELINIAFYCQYHSFFNDVKEQ